MNNKIKSGVVSATSVIGVLLVLCLVVSPEWNQRALNLAVLSAGATIGWLIGVLISPYNPKEEMRFSEISAAVVTFITGYLAAKMDKLVEALVLPTNLSDPVFGFRVLAFVSVLIVSMLITYIFRIYAK